MGRDLGELLASGEVDSDVSLSGPTFGLFSAETSVRIPMAANPVISGPAAVASGSSNTVGFVLAPSVTGDFTGITGEDAGYWWGLNVFAKTGAGASDAAGLTNLYGGLIELAVLKASGTVPVARGMETGVSLFGAAAGATITQAESLRVSAPTKKNGATGGAITTAYGLFVETVSVGSTNFSLFVDGGTSRIKGVTQLGGVLNFGAAGYADIRAGFNASDGANLLLDANSGGLYGSGSAILDLHEAGASFLIRDGTNSLASVFQVKLDGTVEFEGDAGCNLYRSADDTLKTDGIFVANTAARSPYLTAPADTGTYLQLDGSTATFDRGDIALTNGVDIATGTGAGTKIGTATSQKIGFYNATPVVQQTNVTNPTGGATVDAEARTAIDAILSRLETLGLFAA